MFDNSELQCNIMVEMNIYGWHQSDCLIQRGAYMSYSLYVPGMQLKQLDMSNCFNNTRMRLGMCGEKIDVMVIIKKTKNSTMQIRVNGKTR